MATQEIWPAGSVEELPRHAIIWGAFLEETPTFSRIPRPVLRLVAARMTELRASPGDFLMRQGDPGDFMLVVMGGKAEVRLIDQQGQSHILAQPGEGSVLGEMALLTSEPRSADVVALTAVRALVLSASDFHATVSAYPDIAVVLTHLVADRLGQEQRDGLGDKVLNGHRIRTRLGLGATAVVYDAEQMDTGRRVALKMLSHRLVFDRPAIERFHRELAIVEQLSHPNVARVLGRFEAFGTWFMVMEHLDGPSLFDLIIRHAPLHDEQVRRTLGQMALALRHVREAGIVHRDIKPANVMTTTDGVVKLTDFGIARPPPSVASPSLEEDTKFSGTPLYMAPEQFRTHEADSAMDVYALGCLAYELMTGRPAFMASSIGELMDMKQNYELPPRNGVRPDLPEDLYEVLVETLSPDPVLRTLDLAALAAWAAPLDRVLVT